MENYTEEEKKRIYADCLDGKDCRRARRAYERALKKNKNKTKKISLK